MQVVSSLLYIERDEENRIECCACNGIRVIAHRVIALRAIRLFAPGALRPRSPDGDATLLGDAAPSRRPASPAPPPNPCLQPSPHPNPPPTPHPHHYHHAPL